MPNTRMEGCVEAMERNLGAVEQKLNALSTEVVENKNQIERQLSEIKTLLLGMAKNKQVEEESEAGPVTIDSLDGASLAGHHGGQSVSRMISVEDMQIVAKKNELPNYNGMDLSSWVKRTDHSSLHFLLQQHIIAPARQHWLVKLIGYDFQIDYKPDNLNQTADSLSRKIESRPLEQEMHSDNMLS